MVALAALVASMVGLAGEYTLSSRELGGHF